MVVQHEVIVRVRELDLERIRPNAQSVKIKEAGGSKIVVVGKPGSGKSVIIKAILRAKAHLIPVGVVVSGSEAANRFYSTMFPDVFIYEQFDIAIVDLIRQRQMFAKRHLSVPWSAFVMDDCMTDSKPFNDKVMMDLIKNSRHWDLMSIYANQYVYDFKPVIRNSIDGVFILREPNQSSREKIYANFASIIPTFDMFAQLMNALTTDYTCIYIDNAMQTSNDWWDCVFYYKADVVPEDFRFGCEEFWEWSKTRQRA
jgi:ABC-type dipeptide/oligopeptide/nickel transport system ATPase component